MIDDGSILDEFDATETAALRTRNGEALCEECGDPLPPLHRSKLCAACNPRRAWGSREGYARRTRGE